jgi:hypothetical protein
MADATLFEVQTARGSVFAIHDPSTGMVWTERTEQAARLLATDKGFSVTQEKTISQEALLVLTGRDASRPPSTPHTISQPPRPAADNQPKESPPPDNRASNRPQPIATSYHWDDDVHPTLDVDVEPGIIIGGATESPIQDVFAQSEIPVKPPAPAGEGPRSDEDVAGPCLTNDQIHIDPALAKSLEASPPPRPSKHH